jgi:integrase
MSRRKLFSWSAGEYGTRVHVWEDPASGVLWGRVGNTKRSLKHRDTDRAKAWARDQAERRATGLAHAGDPVPTVARVFALYLATQTPRKGSSCQYQDKRAAKMWTRVLGAGKDLHKLTLGEWQGFIDARGSGAIDAQGQPVPAPVKPKDRKRRPVSPRTVESDCEWLQTVIAWAIAWQDKDTAKYLMRENPARGEAFARATPHEENPRRPLATDDRYDAVRAVAGQVDARLPLLLALAHGTGRRIRAILALHHEDLRLAKGEQWPHGRIRWRAEEDKIGKEWLAPMNADVRAALDMLPRAIGPVPPFPGVTYEKASKWLRKAERLAQVAKQKGSLWHAYRRGWATARKHLPVKDVAYAGGWKNAATVQGIYQQPDAESTYRAVAEPVQLREAQHG